MRNFIDKFNSNKKKYIVSLVVVLVFMLSLIGGTSYAILKGNVNDKNEQVIKTGSVELKLTEYYDDISKKITVMSDDDGLLQDDFYSFNIKNTGDSVAKYDLKLVNDVPSSYTGKVLDTKYIKVGLEINGDEYGPMSLDKVKNVIDSDVIYKREMLNYKLRIWLDKSKEKEIENLEDYKAFLKLEVEAVQRPESMDNGVNTKTFAYTGKPEEYTVPREGYYYIELGGASSGKNDNIVSYGAKTSGYVKLEAGEKLYFYVGKAGSDVNTNCRTSGYEFNGGGIALPAKTGVCGASGGGATDVRLVGGSWDDTKSLISRIMVAGAGGGPAGGQYTNGDGGGLSGVTPLFVTYQSNIGVRGTQRAGGTAPTKDSCAQSTGTVGFFGKGGYGGASSASNADTGGGAGGGAGYYGGSGASGLCNGTWPGGGGSSYISGFAGSNSVKNNTTVTHTNDTLHYSGKYFIGGSMESGVTSGNGYAKISYVDVKPKKRNTQLNGVRYIKNCINNDSSNSINNWTEIQAIKDGKNIAKGKSAGVYDSSGNALSSGGTAFAYSYMTDGMIDNVGGSIGYSHASTYTGNQCAVVDLEDGYDLDEVAVWHYSNDMRTYFDDVTYVSSDNKSWTKVINETKSEDYNGKRVNPYVNTYNGYTQDNLVLWLDGYANNGSTRTHTATTWKDLSGNGNTATLSGPTWYDKYLYFDGSNDYAYKTSASYGISNNKYTLEIIVESEKDDVYQPIFNTVNTGTAVQQYMTIWKGKYNYFTLDITNGSTVSQLSSSSKVVNNTKYKLTAVLNGTNYKLYNGAQLDNSIDVSFIPKMYSSGLYIGGNSYYFKGKIYSIRVYNKALSEDEIIHNYNYDKQKFNLE